MKRFFDESFVFIPENDFPIVCSRQKSGFCGSLADFCGFSDDNINFIKGNLNGFSKIPFIVGKERPTFVLTGFYPSSSLCLAIVPDLSAKELAALCREFYFGEVKFSKDFEKIKPAERLSPEIRENFAYLADFLTSISRLFGLLRSENAFSAARKSREIFLTVSDFVGCEFDIDERFPVGIVEGVDLSLVTAFALAASTFVRRAIESRRARLSFDLRGGDLSIILTADCGSNVSAFEFEPLKNYFTTNNYDFSIINQNRRLFIDFCPMRRDFSKLGIKDDPTLKI